MIRFIISASFNFLVIATSVVLYIYGFLDSLLVDATYFSVPAMILIGSIFLFVTINLNLVGKNDDSSMATISLFSHIMVSLGLIGTILGIAYSMSVLSGLEDFNSESVKSVLPQFIGGIATAFNTTFWGICFSLVMNINQRLME